MTLKLPSNLFSFLPENYGLYITTTIVFPLFGVAVSYFATQIPEDFGLGLFTFNSLLVFFPFFAYSISSILLLIKDYQQYAQYFLIRLGVYSGTTLSLAMCLHALYLLFSQTEGSIGDKILLVRILVASITVALVSTVLFFKLCNVILRFIKGKNFVKKQPIVAAVISMLALSSSLLFVAVVPDAIAGTNDPYIWILEAMFILFTSPFLATFFGTLLSWKLLTEKVNTSWKIWLPAIFAYLILLSGATYFAANAVNLTSFSR